MNMAQATAAPQGTGGGQRRDAGHIGQADAGHQRQPAKGQANWPNQRVSDFQIGCQGVRHRYPACAEIRSYEVPTRIANSPHFIKGVVNLRGVIVPVVDLRIKLGCEKVEYNDFTVVIVLNVKGRVVGAVVDSVSDVLELPEADLKASPEMNNSAADNAYVTGIASVGERMLIMMDIQALMSSPDMGLMDDAN